MKMDQVDLRYEQFMESFARLLGIKGRPFGPSNKRHYGLSDGREGVQWNLSVDPDDDMVRIGVNLEGMKYDDWPIARFIVAELQTPTLLNLIPRLEHAEHIVIHFTRDAWQYASRPAIRKENLWGSEMAMTRIDQVTWRRTLEEALGCLDPARDYRGRAIQEVSIIKKSGQDDQKKTIEVSPHLTIRTAMNPGNDSDAEVEAALRRLKPVHDWVSRIVEN